jgi:DNA-binding Lrp family transcriptional regulator
VPTGHFECQLEIPADQGPDVLPRAARRAPRHPEIHRIALVGGDFDVIPLARAIDNTDLRQVIFDQLQSMPGVPDTQTFRVFEDVDRR